MGERDGGTEVDRQVDQRLHDAGLTWRDGQPSPAPVHAGIFASDPGPTVRERIGDLVSPGGPLGSRPMAFAAGAVTTLALVLGVVAVMPRFAPDITRPGGAATVTPSSGYLPTGVASCPLTTPDPAFTPPPAPGADFRLAGDRGWYGSAGLWTWLASDGEAWHGLPSSAEGLTQKTFWWRDGYSVEDEPEPEIYVRGERLDGPGAFVDGPGTNASWGQGSAMLVGVTLPSAGCWKLTAEYAGEELSIVVWAD